MGRRVPPPPDSSDATFERWVRSHRHLRLVVWAMWLAVLLAVAAVYLP